MLWLFVMLMLLYAAFLEGSVQAELRCFDAAELQLRFTVGGIHKTWRYRLNRTEQGHHLTRTGSHGTKSIDPSQFRQSRSSIIADTLRRADKARHFLLSHIHLERLDGFVLLRTEDAAASALLSGTMQGVLGCIPAARRGNVRIRVLPEFFRAHSTVNARCIIRFRLGTTILTAGMLLAAWFRQQRLTESEAMEYGTSHR